MSSSSSASDLDLTSRSDLANSPARGLSGRGLSGGELVVLAGSPNTGVVFLPSVLGAPRGPMRGRDHELSLLGGRGGRGAQHLDGTGRAQGPSPTPTPRAPSDRSRRPLCQMTPRRCPRASLRWPRMESWAPLEGAHLPSRTSALPPWDVGAAALGPAGPCGVRWFAGAWGPWTWRDGGGGAGVHGAVRLRRDQAVPKARMLQRTRGSDARGTSRAEA